MVVQNLEERVSLRVRERQALSGPIFRWEMFPGHIEWRINYFSVDLGMEGFSYVFNIFFTGKFD